MIFPFYYYYFCCFKNNFFFTTCYCFPNTSYWCVSVLKKPKELQILQESSIICRLIEQLRLAGTSGDDLGQPSCTSRLLRTMSSQLLKISIEGLYNALSTLSHCSTTLTVKKKKNHKKFLLKTFLLQGGPCRFGLLLTTLSIKKTVWRKAGMSILFESLRRVLYMIICCSKRDKFDSLHKLLLLIT